LVAHDLVQSSAPISFLQSESMRFFNDRASALMLDTIYGGGPDAHPSAYAIDDNADLPPDYQADFSRTKLRLGAMTGGQCPMRDIARVEIPNFGGFTRGGPTEVLVADARNDDHAVLSQLTTLFHILHNAIVDRLPAVTEKVDADSFVEAAYDRFFCARAAVTVIYRNIIRKDLLPRILHPDVGKIYGGTAVQFLHSSTEAREHPGVPLEFTHGAFRFGHAMLRSRYVFNGTNEFALHDVLKQNSTRRPESMPLTVDWAAQWSYFFDVAAASDKPNLSRRIWPFQNQVLKDPTLFNQIDDGGVTGLFYRDLLSAAQVRLWSVRSLIETIAAKQPALKNISPLFDAATRERAIRKWLLGSVADGTWSDEDLKTLTTDPPLPFFVLFEAAFDPKAQGFRLGALGSIIVADVILGTLARDPLPCEIGGGSLADSLGRLSHAFYGSHANGNVFNFVPAELDNMSQLVRFVDGLRGSPPNEPAFL
jgi:hypothetical protein